VLIALVVLAAVVLVEVVNGGALQLFVIQQVELADETIEEAIVPNGQ
jgi:hypothetical protein